jgi:hypothetical protein
MNLELINERLLVLLNDLQQIIPKYGEIQAKYELRKAQLMMDEETKGFANQALRDAYVIQVLETEQIKTEYDNLHNEIKFLYIEKEILMEVGRNIREATKHD